MPRVLVYNLEVLVEILTDRKKDISFHKEIQQACEAKKFRIKNPRTEKGAAECENWREKRLTCTETCIWRKDQPGCEITLPEDSRPKTI